MHALVGYISAGMMKVVVLGPCNRRGRGVRMGGSGLATQPVCGWGLEAAWGQCLASHPITYEVGEEECQCVEDDKRPATRLSRGQEGGCAVKC